LANPRPSRATTCAGNGKAEERVIAGGTIPSDDNAASVRTGRRAAGHGVDQRALKVAVTSRRFEADRKGFRLDAWGDSSVDVYFDGQRVWSVSGAEHRPNRQGVVSVDWPPRFRRRLDGIADVEVRDHLSGTLVAEARIAFGTGTGSIDLTDDDGRPLSLTKWGRFNRSFDTIPAEVKQRYLDDVERIIRIMRDECGVEPFLAYGALLGAVRDGHLIGHDVDVDLGYLSTFTHPSDITREMLRIERALRRHGVSVLRQNGGFLALHLRQLDGTRRNIDIFTAFLVDGVLYEMNDLEMKADVSDVLPLGTVTCEGRAFPAPARPEQYLEAAYGPGWRVPDPGFAYNSPRRLVRMLTGWFGGLRAERKWWVNYFDRSKPATEPSEYGRLVHEVLPPGITIVEVGGGYSGDSRYFLEAGRRVVAVDFATPVGVQFRKAAKGKAKGSRFVSTNLYALNNTLRLGAQLSREPGPQVVYARRLFDDLRDDGRENFWRLTSMALRGGGRCYVETTVGAPSGPTRRRTARFPPEPERLIAEAARAGGSLVEQTDLRDPRPDFLPLKLSRLVFEWPDRRGPGIRENAAVDESQTTEERRG
jgi:hypothetical protein